MKSQNDTIAAIGTAPAPAAIGIVRVSGPEAEAVLRKIVGAGRRTSRRVMAGMARDPESGEVLDEVLYFLCKGPRTATGEDIAEIHGHGGPVVMSRLLAAVLKAGARPAEPGEFTYRAFASGRIDLTQAEAVMGLIGARSERAARVALGQMAGSLGALLGGHFAELSAVAAHVEAGLDFPDEDLPLALVDTLRGRLSDLAGALERLAATFAFGSRLQEGARVAIVGPPNAGKSSLFNALVAEERAIVDAEPGTTRDVVEARGEVAGIPVSFYDTAGLREAGSRVEQVGIERSHRAADEADLILLVLDGAHPRLEEVGGAFISLLATRTVPKVIVLNKRDLSGWRGQVAAADAAGVACVGISAARQEGVAQLVAEVGARLTQEGETEQHVLTTARQHRAVSDTATHVTSAAALLASGGEPELVAAELKWARDTLSALLGKSATEEMLDVLFSAFCIGK